MATVRLEGLSKRFGDVVAVNEVTATIADGEFVSLLGPSGCGKTTALRMVAGLEKPSAGSIWIDTLRVNGPGVHLPPNERHLGMVFQSYAVWPHMTVYDNVAYPLKVRGQPAAEQRKRVAAMLALVHLDGLEQRRPNQLSGGQQQRVALARALVAEPAVLLLDEPLSGLDAKLREELRLEIKLLSRRLGITVMNVTHDQTEAMGMSDRILVMDHGRVVQEGTPRAIYERPATRYVAAFVGTASFLTARVTEAGGCVLSNGYAVRCAGDVCLPAGTQVELMVRPEGVSLSGDVPAQVVSMLYLGGETELLLDVAGEPVRAKVHSDLELAPDATVSIALQASAIFPKAAL